VIRLVSWPVRRLGPRTLVVLTLSIVALSSVALGLADAIRGLDAGLLLPVATLGLLVGWGLAKSPLPGWLGGAVAFILGLEIIFLRVGRLAGPLSALLRSLVDSSQRVIAFLIWGGWYPGQPDVHLNTVLDWPPILLAWQELWADVGILLVRLHDWLFALAARETSFDLVALAMAWSLVIWVMAAWAGWWVRRRDQPLPGMVPAGALLSGTLFFLRDTPTFLLPLLGATLLLVVFIGYDTRERYWNAARIDFPFDVGLEIKLSGAGLTLMLVMVAALAPSISMHQVLEWADRLVRGQPDRVQLGAGPLASEVQVPEPATVFDEDRVRAPGLPRRHLIGSGPELSERVVMTVYVEGEEGAQDKSAVSVSQLEPEEAAPPYYWRSLTYDQYTGYGWIAGGTETFKYQAGDMAIYKDRFEPPGLEGQTALVIPPGRRQVRVEVRAVPDLGEMLHTAGDLVSVDRDYRVAWRSAEDVFGATLILAEHAMAGQHEPGQATPARGASGGSMDSRLVYRTASLVPAVGEVQLRAAGSDYPGWVQDRYLALPDRVPPRVLALARDLTATEPTPYDRARAIESYLRTFPYNLDLPAPHLERDVADYFLFELKQGYCDYYATAMVVLARAAGLPARLAVGYYTGTYDEADRRYVVTEADAHAWVEVYFPGYGWIEFEPTAGLPPIHRPADVPPVAPSELKTLELTSVERVTGYRLLGLGLLGGVVLLSLGGFAHSVLDAWRLRRMSPEAAIASLYQRLHRHGRRLAVPVRPGDTPFEYVASLTDHLGGLTRKRLGVAVLTPVALEARWLAGLYVRTCYAPRAPDVAEQSQAIRMWRRLRRRLWLAWAFQAGSSIFRLSSPSSSSTHRAGRLPAG